jgi:hypothetical protein
MTPSRLAADNAPAQVAESTVGAAELFGVVQSWVNEGG